MVLEDRYKCDPTHGVPVDQLLEEYLRVINDKDDQLHRLLRQLEDQQATSKQNDEANKARVKELTQQLHRREAKARELQRQCAHDEELNAKLVQHSETLKMQLACSEEKAKELAESTAQMSDSIRVLESGTAALRSTVAALEAERDKNSEALESTQQLLDWEKETTTALRAQCEATTRTLEERKSQVDQLHAQMQTMMPRSEHSAAVAALESAATAVHAQHQRDVDQLEQQLRQRDEDFLKSQQALSSAQKKVTELTDTLQSTTSTLDRTRKELALAAAAAQEVEKELRGDISRRKVAQQELAERVGDLERLQGRAQEALQRTTADLQAALLQHERVKVGGEKALEAAQSQLRGLQDQLQQAQDEAKTLRRQLEVKERVAIDSADDVARLREHVARQEAEAREKAATCAAALATKSDDCNRLEGELRKAQAELQDTQRRTAADERALSRKFEELQVGVHRLQAQLRDKEEETRRMELLHTGEVQKLRHDFASSTEEARSRHDAEVRDLKAHLDRLRAELGERTGGSKGLERELHHLDDTRREMRSEVDRLQSVITAKEAALEACKNTAERQQAELTLLSQRLTTREAEEADARQRLEAAERAQLDWKAKAERAQDTVAALKKAAEASAASVAALHEQLAQKDGVIAGVRREVEDALGARQAALKEVMQQRAQREEVALKLAGVEERLAACGADLREATQEAKKLHRALDESRAEVRQARDDVNDRDAEVARLSKHAEEVEALAKRTSEELHRSVQAREDTIRQLRAEQATVLPQLNEERSKYLVLQERLQHLQEVGQATSEAAEERVRALEEERAARESDVVMLRAEKNGLEQQLSDAAAQISALKATLEGRELKYQQRKEEIQKALRQVEEVKAATAATLQEAEAQSAGASALRDKYKKEKSKMEALMQRMEKKVRESAKLEKEGHQREESLMERLAETEAALRRVQDSMDSRVSETKLRCEEMCRQHEESFREATHDAEAAEKQAKALQAQLLDAQRRATTAESHCREVQRSLAAHQMLAAEEYADDAVEMKRASMDAVLRAHHTLLSHAACCAKDGWAAAQRTMDASRAAVQELERQHVRMETKHKAELNAVEEAHARQREAAAAEHQEEVAQLRREAAEAVRRAALQGDALRRTDGDRDERCRTLEDALERLKALLEMEKAQTAAYRDRIATEELRRGEEARLAQEERRAVQRSHDKLKRQLEDRAVEQKHNEDELREQRAEVAALQRVMDEKERAYRQELDSLQKEAQKTAAVATARDASVKQCEELQAQLDFVRGQLESARASHQRVLGELQAAQRTRDARLEATQAEVATLAAERRRLQADVTGLEHRVNELVKEVQSLRRQETDLVGQLQARKSEVSALRERCANLESLKNISDATLAETQSRERDLTDKIEELRNAQQLMQMCFDKQQEQLEIGRRLRQQDAQMRSRYSP